MNPKINSLFMLILGVLGLLGTLAIQIFQGGELKGEIRANLHMQEQRQAELTDHVKSLHDKDSEHDKAISNIEGRLHGIASQMGKVPGKVAAKLNENSTQ